MENIITGAVFGASLIASGMYQPHTIDLQFSLKSWDMLQMFLATTGCTALLVELFRNLGRAAPPPRAWSSLGLAPVPWDGNVLGGLLLGAGMALSSACPGMALPQLALGLPRARAVVAGSTLGGVVWAAALRPGIERLRRRRARRRAASGHREPPPRTLASALGLGRTTTLVLYEAALAGAVATLPSVSAPATTATGGALLVGGGAQLVSLLLRRGSLLGVSTCYEQLGDWVVYGCRRVRRGRGGVAPRPGTSAMVFAASLVAGAWLLARARPDLAAAPAYHHHRVGGEGGRLGEEARRALVGGLLMAVGSRAAGGCAAGHGISGMALMSVSSLVTMASAFAAAVGVSRLGII